MGVDHGGTGGTPRSRSPPQNLESGDANANCPPQILSYRYKKERPVAPAGGAEDDLQTP